MRVDTVLLSWNDGCSGDRNDTEGDQTGDIEAEMEPGRWGVLPTETAATLDG